MHNLEAIADAYGAALSFYRFNRADYPQLHHPALLEFIFSPILAVLTALICVVAAKWMYKCRLGFLFGK